MTGDRTVRALRRIGLGLVAVVVLLATIDVTTWLKNYGEDVDGAQRPFSVRADMGQAARARTFIATVEGVRGAAVIQDSVDHSTSGVWLIVKVRIVVLDEPGAISYAAVRDAQGRVFTVSERPDGRIAGRFGRLFQPGVPVVGELAFELPRDAATSPTLVLARDADERMDSQVEISLGSNSPATVDRWADDKEPTSLMPARAA